MEKVLKEYHFDSRKGSCCSCLLLVMLSSHLDHSAGKSDERKKNKWFSQSSIDGSKVGKASWESGRTEKRPRCTAAEHMKESALYVPRSSPPPTTSGWKMTSSGPMLYIRGQRDGHVCQQ